MIMRYYNSSQILLPEIADQTFAFLVQLVTEQRYMLTEGLTM